jgi:hypothetical protein
VISVALAEFLVDRREFGGEGRACATAAMAIYMLAVISPYSIAVAAISFLKKEDIRVFIANPFCCAETGSLPNLAIVWRFASVKNR